MRSQSLGNSETDLNKNFGQAPKEMRSVRAYNMLIALVFVGVSFVSDSIFSVRTLPGIITGLLFTALNLEIYFRILIPLVASGQHVISLLSLVLKLPLIFTFVVLVSRGDNQFMWSALFGMLSFFPAGLIWGLRRGS